MTVYENELQAQRLVNSIRRDVPAPIRVESYYCPIKAEFQIMLHFGSRRGSSTHRLTADDAGKLVQVVGRPRNFRIGLGGVQEPNMTAPAGLLNPDDLRKTHTSAHGEVLVGPWISSNGPVQHEVFYYLAFNKRYYVRPPARNALDALAKMNCLAFESKARLESL